jgi:predicted nucleotidyltransferase
MKALDLREKDVAALLDTLQPFPFIQEARVFGSRATGHARRASDIDLAISAPSATAAQWAKVCEALENAPLIYQLDIVRAEQNTNPTLKEKIDREGIVIYPSRLG